MARLATFIDKAERDIERKLRDTFQDLERKMRRHLDRLKSKKGIVGREAWNLRINRQMIEKLQAEIKDSGYSDTLKLQVQKMRELSRQVLREAGDLGLPNKFSPISEEAIDTVLHGTRQNASKRGVEVASELETILMRSLTGNSSRADIIANIEKRLDVSRSQAMSEVTNQMSSFHRQVRVEHAQESGIEWFLYDGPLDDRNRDFCSHFVGTRVTLAILQEHASRFNRSLDAGPVVITLGGFGCRHELVPLLLEFLKDYPIGPR